MKVHYMSDLHLEFGQLEKKLPEGDVLILAGDMSATRRAPGHSIQTDFSKF